MDAQLARLLERWGEPERGDGAMSVHGGVVGSAKTRLEECRRLFGRRTRSLNPSATPENC